MQPSQQASALPATGVRNLPTTSMIPPTVLHPIIYPLPFAPHYLHKPYPNATSHSMSPGYDHARYGHPQKVQHPDFGARYPAPLHGYISIIGWWGPLQRAFITKERQELTALAGTSMLPLAA